MEDLYYSHFTFQVGKCCKKPCADIHARLFDKDTMAMLNAPTDALAGVLKQQHLWDLLFGNKCGMKKMHIIVKTTLLPHILWIVQVTHHQCTAQ
jgi:hypothetical protein